MNKKDIRLQVFVTEEMNNQIEKIGMSVGLKKNDVVRMAIVSYIQANSKLGIS